MLHNHIVGMSVAIIEPSHTLYCNYGYTDLSHKHKVNQFSIFSSASITKLFTANLVALAAIDKKLSLNDKVVNFLPELANNPGFESVSILDLLTHHSGLPINYPYFFEQSNPKKFIESLQQLEFADNNGKYIYSNIGIALAAILVERAYHQSYQSLVSRNILSKFGLDHSYFRTPRSLKNQAVGYNYDYIKVNSHQLGVALAAVGLKSCSFDLARYIKLQLNQSGSMKFHATQNLIHFNYICFESKQMCQQLVWEYYPDRLSELNSENSQDTGTISKTGNFEGMSSYIAYQPLTKKGIVILTNRGGLTDLPALATKLW